MAATAASRVAMSSWSCAGPPPTPQRCARSCSHHRRRPHLRCSRGDAAASRRAPAPAPAQLELELAQARKAEVAQQVSMIVGTELPERARPAARSSPRARGPGLRGSPRGSRGASPGRRARASLLQPWTAGGCSWRPEVHAPTRVGVDPVVVVDERHPAPFVEGGARVRDAERHAIADLRRCGAASAASQRR